MADYRLKLYLGVDDVIDVTCKDQSDDFKEFLDSFGNYAFATFNDGSNNYIAARLSHVTKIEATKIN